MKVALQPNHQNVQTAKSQCLPAAVANSLQWLEDTYGTNVPHDNVLGLRGDPPNSLIGQLDLTMMRAAKNRADGETVGILTGLRGKIQYLANNGLGGLVLQHQGFGGDADVTVAGVTSKGQGTTVTADFIIDEIMKGEDVELIFLHPGDKSGHVVEVVGAGTILGVPWILHRSDYLQTNADPTDTMGTDRTDFTFLRDTDGDGRLNLVYNKAGGNVAAVFTQSIPEPSTYLLLFVGLVGLALKARQQKARK